MDSGGYQITPVMRLGVLLGLLWSAIAMALAYGGLGITAFFVVAVAAAPLDVYLLRRSGRNTYDAPDRPPRRPGRRVPPEREDGPSSPPGAADAQPGREATARR
jgi:hypothetical protein